jgi:hypothetical protein
MEYNVTTYCVFYMIDSGERIEALSAFKYTAMPNLPEKGKEFRIIRNNKASTFRVIEFLGQAYSLEANNSCMQSFTYLVIPVDQN